MPFLYANWQLSLEGGREPQLPDNLGFLLIAEPGTQAGWALFSVSLAEDACPEGLTPVGDQLRGLLESGMAFPPAIALARDEVARQFDGQSASRTEFEAYYAGRLRHHLAGQDRGGYLLAEAVLDEIGYLTRGSFYWLVEYLPQSKQVKWVSDDYFIYVNDATCFDVPRYRLVPLSRWQTDENELAGMIDAIPPIEHPGELDAANLQKQIDAAVETSGAPLAIKLGPGAEDTDLTCNADVEAEWQGFRRRIFRVVSQDWVSCLFSGSPAEFIPTDVYAVGGPLIIVKRIDGSSIVRGVLRYLQLEDRRW